LAKHLSQRTLAGSEHAVATSANQGAAGFALNSDRKVAACCDFAFGDVLAAVAEVRAHSRALLLRRQATPASRSQLNACSTSSTAGV
jgi:hypothetical protein